MVLVLGVIGLLGLVLWLYCLFDVLTTPREDVHTLSKLAWIAVVVLFLDFGAIAWLLFGRPRGETGVVRKPNLAHPSHPSSTNQLGGTRGSGSASDRPPLGPDDDPEFLRRLDRRREDDDGG
ncbi:MAG: hypothetical protein GEV03_09785 [Streptosporangiales bacterium]|nr:hypothetical protein [Streptosporangiales bacterium]